MAILKALVGKRTITSTEFADGVFLEWNVSLPRLGDVCRYRVEMTRNLKLSQISIRTMLLATCFVAVAIAMLRRPDSRAEYFVCQLQSRRTAEVLALITPPRDLNYLGNFEDILRDDNVFASTLPPDIWQYIRCERTVVVTFSQGMVSYEFDVGLLEITLKSITERPVSRGDLQR